MAVAVTHPDNTSFHRGREPTQAAWEASAALKVSVCCRKTGDTPATDSSKHNFDREETVREMPTLLP